MNFHVITCFALLCSLSTLHAEDISCEKIIAPDKSGRLKACFMESSTTIYTTGVKIADRDSTIQKLTFENNKNISYLPISIGDNFPNLHFYAASKCSIEEIYKANFKNLGKLIKLFLDNNQITELYGGTFEDLTTLKELRLNNNKIKVIDPNAFISLDSLLILDLKENDCLSERIPGEKDLAKLTEIVAEKCKKNDADFQSFTKQILGFISITLAIFIAVLIFFIVFMKMFFAKSVYANNSNEPE